MGGSDFLQECFLEIPMWVWGKQGWEGEAARFRQRPSAEGSFSLTPVGGGGWFLEGKSYLRVCPDSRPGS